MSALNRGYTLLPAPAQNVALSLWGIKYRWDRMGAGYAGEVARFREREGWSPEKMNEFVEGRLRELLLHAFRTAPYYRRRWKEVGIEEGDLLHFSRANLPSLPPTPKQDLRTHPEAFRSESSGWPRHGRTLVHTTSGSTGTPTTMFLSPRNLRQFTASREVRSYGWAGTSLSMPRATIGARVIVSARRNSPPFHRYNYTERQLYLSAFHLSRENLPDYVEGFNRHRPEVLTGLAHSYYLLAQFMLEAGLQLAYVPRAAILGSEKITPVMRRTIEQAFRTRVFEEYASVENCALATECEHGSLHISPDFGILEIVDEQGAAVRPGQTGHFVCTGLFNRVQPLVRFEIGDLGSWSRNPCSCGRSHFPTLENIAGRENDVVVLEDGRRIATGDEVFTGVSGVVEGQVVQEGLRDFVLNVVPDAGFGAEQERLLREALRRKMGDVEVSIRLVGEIPRGKSGKFQPIVSRIR